MGRCAFFLGVWVVATYCGMPLVRAEPACDSGGRLKKISGSYVAKQLWDELVLKKNWSEVTSKNSPMNGYPTLWIDKTGEPTLSSWHEAASNACLNASGDKLWAYSKDDPKRQRLQYIRIGDIGETVLSDALLGRIFGKQCFQDAKGARWCFDRGTLAIGERKYVAQLVMDGSEMPGYGTPLSVGGQKDFWIFVPYATGYKVFRDVLASDPKRKPINPNVDIPWQILQKLS